MWVLVKSLSLIFQFSIFNYLIFNFSIINYIFASLNLKENNLKGGAKIC